MFLSQLVKGSGLCSTVPKSHGVVSCKGVTRKGHPPLSSIRLAMLTLQSMAVGSSFLQRNLPTNAVRWGQLTENPRDA